MKKIVLKRFQADKENYQVYLGDGRRFKFTSQRDLVAFIRKSNKFLSQKAFEIHIIYMDLWQEYQRCWFYFGYGDSNYSLHISDQTKCSELLCACEERLTYCLKKEDWHQTNPFPFSDLTKAVNLLECVIDILIPLYKKRSQTAELYRMNAFYKRLAEMEKSVLDYGKSIPSAQLTTYINTKLKKYA